MNKAYLLIGGNTGNRQYYLQQARNYIQKLAGLVRCASKIYETAAWGKTDQNAFLNQVLLIETTLEPQHLLETLLDIELQLGRIRHEKYGSRTIDIDILFYNDIVLQTPTLTVPHPALPDRRFALHPLAEIAADYVHPVLNKNMQTLLTDCTDPLEVCELDNKCE